MKIGILSDTHDRPAGIAGSLEVFSKQNVALILHCGDWTKPDTAATFAKKAAEAALPVRGVLGNNDREIGAFLELNSSMDGLELREGVLRIDLDGKSAAVYHGHHKPTLMALLAEEELDVLFLGHSHKPRYDRIDDRIILNPGSTAFAIPRSRTWRASVAVYDTDLHEAEFVYYQ